MALSNALTEETAQAKLQTWLQRRHPDARVTNVNIPSKSGLSAETVMFTAEWGGSEHRLVARVQPTGPALFLEYNFPVEFEVLEALSHCDDVPVPDAVFLEMESQALGAPFYVMSRADGRVAEDDPPFTMDSWVLDLSPAERARMSDEGLKTLAALHSYDPKQLGLYDVLHKPELGDNANLQLVSYWETFYNWGKGETPNMLIERGLQWLRDNAPNDDDRLCVCWGDSRIGNMIIADDLSTAAVLDWEMVALGAPELDLAWWMFLMRHHTIGIGAALPEGFPDDAETLEKYEKLTGKPVKNLDYYMVFAGVRMCILVLRAANLMIGAGLLPTDAQMGKINPAANLTATMLGLTQSDESVEYYFGNR